MMVWMGVLAALAAQWSVPETSVQGVTIEGRAFEGRWLGLDDEGRIVLQDDQTHELAPSEIANLTWPTTAPASATSEPDEQVYPWRVYLPDQSRFAATIAKGDSDGLTFKTGLADELPLDLGDIAAIQFAGVDDPELTNEFRDLIQERDPSEDTLIVLRDGSPARLKGITEALTAERLTFRWRDRSREFAIDKVFGLLLASGLQSGKYPPVQCILKAGELWAGRLVSGDRDRLVLELASGAQVPIPVAQLAEMRFRSDRVLYLSDLEPADYECEPFASTRWEWRRDRSVANRPMRIGKRSYARGIGMHSQSKLVFNLEPGYKHFAADIGIDEAVGHHGHVVMRVVADGREVFNSGPVTGPDDPKSILVPVENVKELALIVDYGQDLDIGDQANWANARLVK